MRLLLPLLAIQTCTLVGLPAVGADPAPANTVQAREDEDIRRWLDRLSDEDRSAVDAGIGFAAPELPSSLEWLGTPPFESIKDLKGRVLVVQTWTCGTSQGRSAPRRVARALKDIEGGEDLRVVLLHTPEGMDRARAWCERNRMEHPVAFDADGSACDLMGAYKRPVNFVIDREGEVRYAGLNDRGLKAAVEKVVAEPFDADAAPPERPEPTPSGDEADGAGEYPAISGAVGSARDLRGKRAPEFAVERWITPEPDARGKVAIVDFWATWCGPCIASIPHMNQLANQFRGQVECVGISDEKPDAFEKGLKRAKLDGSSFAYNLALDSRGRMKNAFQIRGIPHVAVMSTDWVVRWQGHPARLTRDILQQIVDADPGLSAGSGSGAMPGRPPARWAGGSTRGR